MTSAKQQAAIDALLGSAAQLRGATLTGLTAHIRVPLDNGTELDVTAKIPLDTPIETAASVLAAALDGIERTARDTLGV